MRGKGLYIGVEFVKDRVSLEPAKKEIVEIVNLLKDDHKILTSCDYSVLRIKPPLCFSKEDGEYLVESVDKVLTKMKERELNTSKL